MLSYSQFSLSQSDIDKVKMRNFRRKVQEYITTNGSEPSDDTARGFYDATAADLAEYRKILYALRSDVPAYATYVKLSVDSINLEQSATHTIVETNGTFNSDNREHPDKVFTSDGEELLGSWDYDPGWGGFRYRFSYGSGFLYLQFADDAGAFEVGQSVTLSSSF